MKPCGLFDGDEDPHETIWDHVKQLSDAMVLKLAEEYGFWSPAWEDDYGRPVNPDVGDLRGAIYDAWCDEN